MIVVDANIFLRYLAPLTTDQDQEFHRIAAEVFERAILEPDVFTCDGAVIAEVVFILAAPLHYGMLRKDVVKKLAPLLRLRGCEIHDSKILIDGLEYWEIFPGISYVDSIGLARALSTRSPLLTFDKRLARVYRMFTEGIAREPSLEGPP